MNQSSKEIVQPEQLNNSEQKDQDKQVSPSNANAMLSAAYIDGQTPIERLRNKLSPFLNLSAILNDNSDLVLPFVENTKKNKMLNKLFEEELEKCQQNIDDIYKYLSDCDEFYNRR